MKTTHISRIGQAVVALSLTLAAAACDEKKTPEDTMGGNPKPLKMETIIFEPKVAQPGDTIVFTAIVTSTSPNVGEVPVMKWTANGGEFIEDDEFSVRWIAPTTPGIFGVTAKATNAANSVTSDADVFVGSARTLIDFDAGEITLIGAGPNFHFLRYSDILGAVDVSAYIDSVTSDAVDPLRADNVNVVYSPDGNLEAHQADSLLFGAFQRPRHVYIGNFATRALRGLTKDRANPLSNDHHQFGFPSFSPNSQLVAYQGWLQSWDDVAPDSFHVFVHDLALQQRTLVTYEHEEPRNFFPTFSTDGNWLTYISDPTHNGQWDLYGSPMTGNVVDGSLASLTRLTNTGGTLVTGQPNSFKNPVKAWNPVAAILAIVSSDGTLYLVETTATGSNVIDVPDPSNPRELVWSQSGALLAASTGTRIVTITSAGSVTERVVALAGDNLRDLAWSPNQTWLLYRVTRGGGSWFEVVDIGAAVLTAPLPVTVTATAGELAVYRGLMSMRPAWTASNQMIYTEFGLAPPFESPGVVSRDLSGLGN